VSAKIALGRRLDEINNAVTGRTCAAYEPALDYLVVKVPRWPFDKFAAGDRTLGTQMKATGEVMAIDRCFEAALQKAVRSLEFRGRSLLWEEHTWGEHPPGDPLAGPLGRLIDTPNDLRLWAMAAAVRRDADPEALARRSGWDRFFVDKLRALVALERRLLTEPLSSPLLRAAKRAGFSDVQIGTLADRLPEQVRELRRSWAVRPVYKMVDTCAAEFEAQTPYFYSTYEVENEAPALEGPKALVLGSGPIRIGQGIEFDYCSVHAAQSLRRSGVKSVMVNSNPETVSTDFDASSRLYFEPLDEEGVRDILENEMGGSARVNGASPPVPTLAQFGGQTAINLAEPLARAGFPLLGSDRDTIDAAEDRARFDEIATRAGVPQPPGTTVHSVSGAIRAARVLGYPVIVRPSYVLGGWAMEIARDEADLRRYAESAVDVSPRHPLLIDKYLEGAEIEVDAIADGSDVLVPGVMEHVERAGVHSGDSISIYPARSLSSDQIATVVDYTVRLGRGLSIRGLFNVQYVLYRGEIYVLEANPRASRTVPFLTKATGVPMVDLATRIGLGACLAELGWGRGLVPERPLVAVKAPVFSMSKLAEVDIYLGPEMKSTGEVMGIDRTYHAALCKALIAAGLMPRPRATFLLSVADRDKPQAEGLVRRLSALGCPLMATEGTARWIQNLGYDVRRITKKLDAGHPNVVDVIRSGEVDAVVNTLTGDRSPLRDGFRIRRAAVECRVPCFTSLDTLSAVVESLEAGLTFEVDTLDGYLVTVPSQLVAP
jgi:carbamoyl-phosphate synthase large subunit